MTSVTHSSTYLRLTLPADVPANLALVYKVTLHAQLRSGLTGRIAAKEINDQRQVWAVHAERNEFIKGQLQVPNLRCDPGRLMSRSITASPLMSAPQSLSQATTILSERHSGPGSVKPPISTPPIFL